MPHKAAYFRAVDFWLTEGHLLKAAWMNACDLGQATQPLWASGSLFLKLSYPYVERIRAVGGEVS